MEQNEINEGNKLIARFMGWEEWEGDIIKVPNAYPILNDESRGWTTHSVVLLEFHWNWNWLVPVYNRCRAKHLMIVKNKLPESDKDRFWDSGYMLAETALKNCLSPSLNNRLEITRAYAMICGFVKWHLKMFPITTSPTPARD